MNDADAAVAQPKTRTVLQRGNSNPAPADEDPDSDPGMPQVKAAVEAKRHGGKVHKRADGGAIGDQNSSESKPGVRQRTSKTGADSQEGSGHENKLAKGGRVKKLGGSKEAHKDSYDKPVAGLKTGLKGGGKVKKGC
jgi:hypothetical protein